MILNACPAYETDALLRKVNMDRYDDREIVRTNLIESFDLLMDFARKHFPDKFFLEDENRVSLRNVLAREIIGNTLMHREFTSSYTAKFVIQKERMYTENANRATGEGFITPDNLEPNPKNPIIASFFRNIGRADWLGSGVRNLFKYSKFYSGQDPEFQEGDVFRTIVPLDDAYSFDLLPLVETSAKVRETNAKDMGIDTRNVGSSTRAVMKLTNTERRILDLLKENPAATQNELAAEIGLSNSGVRYAMARLKEKGLIDRIGSHRNGGWRLNILEKR